MFFTFAVVTALAIVPGDTVPAPAPSAGPFIEAPVGIGAPPIVDDTTPSRRRKAVEISDMYALRLKIHYIASYATIPIFAAQAVVGEQLYNAENKGNPPPAGMRGLHDGIAVALAGLFAVNTVTGAWNLVGNAPSGKRAHLAHDSRRAHAARRRRIRRHGGPRFQRKIRIARRQRRA